MRLTLGDGPMAEKPFFVPDSWEDLHGPDAGEVELPLVVDWSPRGGHYDLSDPADVVKAYVRVISDSPSCAFLCGHISPRLLPGVWPRLYIDGRIRAAWESLYAAELGA